MYTLATERAVLGTLFLYPETQPIIITQLGPEDFSVQHRSIFEAVEHLYEKDREIDYPSVESVLERRDVIDASVSWLSEYYITSPDRIDERIEQIKSRTASRKLSDNLLPILNKIRNKPERPESHIADLQAITSDNLEKISVPGLTRSEIIHRDKNKPRYQKLSLGDRFMDHEFYDKAGNHKGQLEVEFGITKHGKTYYAAWKAASYLNQGYRGLYHTHEARDRDIVDRVGGDVHPDYQDNLIYSDTAQGCTDLESLLSTIRYHNAVTGLDFVIVDYTQIIPSRTIDYHKSVQRVEYVIRSLTDLAKNEDIFVIALAQPHQISDSRHGWQRRPQVKDLHGSTQIQKDCFCATSIFRPVEVEELQIWEGDRLLGVKDYDGNQHEKNAVFIKQELNREAEKYHRFVKFLHTDKGLVRVPDEKKDHLF